MSGDEQVFTRRTLAAPIALVAIFGVLWLVSAVAEFGSGQSSTGRLLLFSFIGLVFFAAGTWGVWHVVRDRYVVSSVCIKHISASGKVLETINWQDATSFEFERRIAGKGGITDYFRLTSDACHIQLYSDLKGWDTMKELILARLPAQARVDLEAAPHRESTLVS